METVLTTLAKLRSYLGIRSNLEAKEWVGEIESKDSLYFLNFEHHCFVLLYKNDLKAAYIADGGNIFRKDLEVAKRVRTILKIRLISLAFNQQLEVDHCGSSAILIAIELLRIKTTRIREIVSSKETRNALIKILHPKESKPIQQTRCPSKYPSRVKCPHCIRTFRTTQKNSLNIHIRRSHQNK